MSLYKKMAKLISIILLCLALFQCSPQSMSNRKNWNKTPLTKRLLNEYSVQQEHIELLQYYLSERIELERGSYKNYNYVDHGLELGDRNRGLIVFTEQLPGQYIRHDEKKYVEGWRFWKKKSRSRFIVHFEEPPINLEFIESNDGKYVLDTTPNKRNQHTIYFEGKKYTCVLGQNAHLEIDTRQLKKINDPNWFVAGAPFIDDKGGGWGDLWKILVGMGALLLIAFLLDNNEQ
jgi:hypothetical protein